MRPDLYEVLQRLLLWLLGTCLLALLILGGPATRLDDLFYDVHLRHWQYAPDDDVVIVAIDPRSVAALGAWPWPRRLHAQLLDRLAAAGVRGVGMDVTISEPSATDPAGDQLLAEAIRRNGRVVMPIFAEPDSLGGPPEEMPPIPAVAAAAAAIGQVEVPLDADGLARGMYLRAGIGRPYWPSMALALYQLGRPPVPPEALPGLRNPAPGADQPYLWMRDHHVLLRYAGPAGSFGRVSYVDVLRGEVPPALLKGRWVLVGATSAGLGDNIPTPASTEEPTMPGVEYQANALESLAHGRLVAPAGFGTQFLLGALLLAATALLSLLPGLRRGWPAVLAALPAAAVLSVALLRGAGLWWPPAEPCLVLGLALALWGAARLLRAWRRPQAAARLPLAGRRRFGQALALEARGLRQEGRPLSLLLVEVGNLDRYGARYGRQAGEEALQQVGAALAASQAVRPGDLAGRCEERVFALLLPRCPRERAWQAALALRDELLALPLPWAGSGMAEPLRLALGVASLVPAGDDDGRALLAQARASLQRDEVRPGTQPDAAGSAAAEAGEAGRQRVEESLR
jgi:diguanylate cyclase (GGDEF)-like protein